jgi:hypothetical protein
MNFRNNEIDLALGYSILDQDGKTIYKSVITWAFIYIVKEGAVTKSIIIILHFKCNTLL